jgi:hypothetical protein
MDFMSDVPRIGVRLDIGAPPTAAPALPETVRFTRTDWRTRHKAGGHLMIENL